MYVRVSAYELSFRKRKKGQATRQFLVVLLWYCRVLLSLSLSLPLRLRFVVIDTFSSRGDVYKIEPQTAVRFVFVMMFWLFFFSFSHCLLFLRKKDCSLFFYPYRFVYFEHFNKGKFQFILLPGIDRPRQWMNRADGKSDFCAQSWWLSKMSVAFPRSLKTATKHLL